MTPSMDSESAEMSSAQPRKFPSTLTAQARHTPSQEQSSTSASSVTSPDAGRSESRASVSM